MVLHAFCFCIFSCRLGSHPCTPHLGRTAQLTAGAVHRQQLVSSDDHAGMTLQLREQQLQLQVAQVCTQPHLYTAVAGTPEDTAAATGLVSCEPEAIALVLIIMLQPCTQALGASALPEGNPKLIGCFFLGTQVKILPTGQALSSSVAGALAELETLTQSHR